MDKKNLENPMSDVVAKCTHRGYFVSGGMSVLIHPSGIGMAIQNIICSMCGNIMTFTNQIQLPGGKSVVVAPPGKIVGGN